MITIEITRIIEGNFQTLGNGSLWIDAVKKFDFVTLELPNRHNKINISSIPTDNYKGEVITRPNGKKAILIKNVPNRTAILIHTGNFNTDVKGCILVGSNFKDLNSDQLADVYQSTITMNQLLSYLPLNTEFNIIIKKILA